MNDSNLLRSWVIKSLVALVIGLVANAYLFFPGNLVDRTITKYTSIASGEIGKLFTDEIYKSEDLGVGYCVTNNSLNRVFVGDGCNARNIVLLYLGFLLTIPFGDKKRKIKYFVVGTLLIFTFNIARITLLFLIAAHMPEFFKMMHKYFFQISIYLLMFYLWHRFAFPLIENDLKKSSI
jgi:exosortase/archaeosortase family protein